MYPGVGTHWLAHFTKLEGISAEGKYIHHNSFSLEVIMWYLRLAL